MSTKTQPPDITAHLDAAERAGAALVDALRAALDATPDEPHLSGVRQSIVSRIALAARAGDNAHERALLAEVARPKGPMVEVCSPIRRGGITTGRYELADVTTGALIMHNGDRYSRKTGKEIGYKWSAWSAGAPYITAEERARVLALPRPPAPARPRTASKEPRQ